MCPRGVRLRPLAVRLSQARAVALGGLPYPAGELLQTKKESKKNRTIDLAAAQPVPAGSRANALNAGVHRAACCSVSSWYLL